jgi:hypothetical protein
VSLALGLLPFAGIAFLWFIGVVRDRLGPALSTSSLLDELSERRPMTVVFVSGAWRQFCCAAA